MFTSAEMIEKLQEFGSEKAKKSLGIRLILGFLAGALISFGYMGYIKITALVPGGVGEFLGAAVFPVGLIAILVLGAELVTSNIMIVGISYFEKKVSLKTMISNWLCVFLGNILGALFVALLFGIYLGSMEPFKETVASLAIHKAEMSFLKTVVSGIACNWFVGIGTWIFLAGKDGFAKIGGLWFPIMFFVLCGFQHSVANAFLMSMGVSWNMVSFTDAGMNIVAAFLGNVIGGFILISFLMTLVNKHLKHH